MIIDKYHNVCKSVSGRQTKIPRNCWVARDRIGGAYEARSHPHALKALKFEEVEHTICFHLTTHLTTFGHFRIELSPCWLWAYKGMARILVYSLIYAIWIIKNALWFKQILPYVFIIEDLDSLKRNIPNIGSIVISWFINPKWCQTAEILSFHFKAYCLAYCGFSCAIIAELNIKSALVEGNTCFTNIIAIFYQNGVVWQLISSHEFVTGHWQTSKKIFPRFSQRWSCIFGTFIIIIDWCFISFDLILD